MLATALGWLLGAFDDVALGSFGGWFWAVSIANLGIGLLAPMLAAAFAAVRRGRAWLLPSVLLMPVYWLLISVAGYRALLDLARRPFHWEKTRHGLGGAPSSHRKLPPPVKPPRALPVRGLVLGRTGL